MKKYLLSSIHLLFMLLCLSCSKDDHSDSRISELINIKSANITDAHLLFVAGNTNGTKAESSSDKQEQPKLYKQTYNGSTDEIEFKDQYGNRVSAVTNYVINLSDELIFLNLGIDDEDFQREEFIFFVRKSDGAVFQPDGNDGKITARNNDFTYFGQSFYESYYLQNKGKIKSVDNITYLLTGINEYNVSEVGTLYKIYTSQNNLKMEAVSSIGMGVYGFEVNKGNNILFRYGTPEINYLSAMALPSGNYLTIPFDLDAPYKGNFQRIFYTISQPDYFYYLNDNKPYYKDNLTYFPLYRISTDGLTIEQDSITSVPFGNISDFYIVAEKSFILGNGYCLIFTDENNYEISKTDFPPNSTNYKLPVYKNYIYNFLDTDIIRLNVNNGEIEVLHQITDCQILKLDVDSNGEIYVTGYELATGAKIHFGISDSGRTDYTYLNNGKKVIQLERIN